MPPGVPRAPGPIDRAPTQANEFHLFTAGDCVNAGATASSVGDFGGDPRTFHDGLTTSGYPGV